MDRIRFYLKQASYTELLIGINVIFFLVSLFVGSLYNFNFALVIMGGQIPSFVLNGEIWRLITYAFLHGNILHIGLNMYFLWQLGKFVERFFGRDKFLIAYLFTAFTGGLLSFSWNLLLTVSSSEVSNPISVGASAAIFGLLGLILGQTWQTRRYGVSLPIDYNQLYFIIFANLALGFLVPSIDNAGHIGGLVGGILISFLIEQSISVDSVKWKRKLVKILLPALLFLTAAAFVAQAISTALSLS